MHKPKENMTTEEETHIAVFTIFISNNYTHVVNAT